MIVNRSIHLIETNKKKLILRFHQRICNLSQKSFVENLVLRNPYLHIIFSIQSYMIILTEFHEMLLILYEKLSIVFG